MNELNEKEYNKLFFKNLPSQLDGERPTPKEFFTWQSLQKYDDKQKSELITYILENYDISNKNIYDKISKCIPNGLNKHYSIEDNEYENLKREFEI